MGRRPVGGGAALRRRSSVDPLRDRLTRESSPTCTPGETVLRSARRAIPLGRTRRGKSRAGATPIIALYHQRHIATTAHAACAERNDQVRLRHRRCGVLAGQGHRFCVPRRDPRIAGPQSHPHQARSVPQRRSGHDVAVPARRGVRHRRRRRDRPRPRPLRALHHHADASARTTSPPARSTRACSRRSAAATTSARRCR